MEKVMYYKGNFMQTDQINYLKEIYQQVQMDY